MTEPAPTDDEPLLRDVLVDALLIRLRRGHTDELHHDAAYALERLAADLAASQDNADQLLADLVAARAVWQMDTDELAATLPRVATLVGLLDRAEADLAAARAERNALLDDALAYKAERDALRDTAEETD